MILTEQKIRKIYNKYVLKAERKYFNKSYSDCLQYLKVSAHTGYYFYLGYRDNDIESILFKVSNKLKHVEKYLPSNGNGFVFYDSFSIDNGGLVQQYLSALIASKYEITYITERYDFLNKKSAIRDMLESYGDVSIIVVPSGMSLFQKSQFVYDSIVKVNTDKLLIHTNPSAVYANTAFYALPKEIIRYKINLTDHTFWIGAGCFDYSFEFRPFGCTLSSLKRGIANDKIFYLPFYPIMNKKGFRGFPEKALGKVKLFSGGAYYKVFDTDDTFFKLTKAILEKCPNIIILYAGIGEPQKMINKIIEYGMESRFLLLGERNDITEVFENCDIYLNTFPFGGGLMSQYAAQLGKPIVNYCTPTTAKVEEFVCQRGYIELSSEIMSDVVDKVKLLSDSVELRDELGKQIKSCVISPDVFCEKFKLCIDTRRNQIPYIDNSSLEEHTMDIQDKLNYDSTSKEFARSISKILGVKTFLLEPLLFFDAIKVVIKDNRLKSVIINNIKNIGK